MATQPFQWMGNQAITSPEQAARKRAVAEALIGQSATPGRNWSEGLADIAAALSGTVLEGRVSDAEAQGRERAGGLFADLAVNQDPNAIIAALTSPDAAWASPAQTSIASALLNSGLERQDPMYQAKLAQLEAQAANGFGGSAPSNVQEWQYYSQLPPDQQSQYLTMKRSNTPLNIGTGYVTQDMANPGQVLGGPIAIDNQTPAYDKGFGGATGTAAGENQVLADSVVRKMPGLRKTIDTLTQLADTATYTQSGQIMDNVKRELGLDVGQGAIDRASYIAIVDNQVLPLLKDTFGAAFTVQEGESLRATLGDPNKSPAEKKAILEAFISQKERDVSGMQSNMPGGSPAPATAAPITRVFNPATGRLE